MISKTIIDTENRTSFFWTDHSHVNW